MDVFLIQKMLHKIFILLPDYMLDNQIHISFESEVFLVHNFMLFINKNLL